MPAAVLIVEGVIRKPVGGYLIPEGARLANSLAGTGDLFLITEEQDTARAKDWLATEGVTKVADVRSFDPGETVHDVIRRYRGEWKLPVDLVVVADPDAAAGLIASGLNVLLFTHAAYARPDWRPDFDGTIRPWDTISKQVADDARKRALAQEDNDV